MTVLSKIYQCTLLCILYAFQASSAYASTTQITGSQIDTVQIFREADGSIRLSLHSPVATTASCAIYPGWYATSATSRESEKKTIHNTILFAKATGATLRVVGTGACDTNGVEVIYYIELL